MRALESGQGSSLQTGKTTCGLSSISAVAEFLRSAAGQSVVWEADFRPNDWGLRRPWESPHQTRIAGVALKNRQESPGSPRRWLILSLTQQQATQWHWFKKSPGRYNSPTARRLGGPRSVPALSLSNAGRFAAGSRRFP